MEEYVHVPSGGEISFMAVTLKVSAEGCLACGNRQLLYVEGITTSEASAAVRWSAVSFMFPGSSSPGIAKGMKRRGIL